MAGALLDTHRFAYSKAIRRLLLRLSKNSLLHVVLLWLSDPQCALQTKSAHSTQTYHSEQKHSFPSDSANSADAVASIYREWAESGSVSRRDVVERVLEVDWPNGLNAKQIAMLDLQYLYDHPTALHWTACRVDPHTALVDASLYISPFLTALHGALDTVFSNYVYTALHPTLPLRLLRIQLHEPAAVHVIPPPRRVFYVALPLASPYLFHSALRDAAHALLVQALATALSRGHPAQLRDAHVTLRSLHAMVARRGASRHSFALGAWRVYADALVDASPVDPLPPPPNLCDSAVAARFGHVDPLADALDRLSFRLEATVHTHESRVDASESRAPETDAPFRPAIWLVLEGSHVLDGLREMCVRGQADARRMPAWLTGDESVTEGTVCDGVLAGHSRH